MEAPSPVPTTSSHIPSRRRRVWRLALPLAVVASAATISVAYAQRAPNGGRITRPVLFFHALNDPVCATVDAPLAGPMRAFCDDLTELTVPTGHWMAQERPELVNAGLARWLAQKFPTRWRI